MPGAYEWKKVLGRVSLHIGALLGKLGRGSIYREHRELAEGGLWLCGISLYGSSVRGTWRGAPLQGTL
jgi:hypothetical protein